MAALTIIKYTGISIEDAEVTVGAQKRARETDHEAFVREIKALVKGGKKKKFPRNKKGQD